MPLHGQLEAKRRRNIARLQEAGCCHICECTSPRCYSHFIPDEEEALSAKTNEKDHHTSKGNQINNESKSSQNEATTMRTCQCYGIEDEDGQSWPFSLRVCEACIRDDEITGRIRLCGICGIVACDEQCGMWELVECTDGDKLNNEGCLDCRGLESFSEMPIFRCGPYPNGCTRVMRVCMRCIELFHMYSREERKDHHFKCPFVQCDNYLIPSDIVEAKRYSRPFLEKNRFLEPFPLSSLPEALIRPIFYYLGGQDLINVGLTCRIYLRKAEQVAMLVVQSVNYLYPSGPITTLRSGRLFARGKNDFPLRAPVDEQAFDESKFDAKKWLPLLRAVEKLAQEFYYLDFLMSDGSDHAPSRFVRCQQEQLSFCPDMYLENGNTGSITPLNSAAHPADPDIQHFSIRGGHVLVAGPITSTLLKKENNSLVFLSNDFLSKKVHYVICRFFCKNLGDGSVGLLCRWSDGTLSWQAECPLFIGYDGENVVGLEVDLCQHSLQVYTINKENFTVERKYQSFHFNQQGEQPEQLGIAVSICPSLLESRNQLSIRECSEEEWGIFLSHVANPLKIPEMEFYRDDLDSLDLDINNLMHIAEERGVLEQYYLENERLRQLERRLYAIPCEAWVSFRVERVQQLRRIVYNE